MFFALASTDGAWCTNLVVECKARLREVVAAVCLENNPWSVCVGDGVAYGDGRLGVGRCVSDGVICGDKRVGEGSCVR